MKLNDFDYSLPQSLIAQYPSENRTGSRLLALDRATGRSLDRQFTDLPEFLQPGDLLVFNDTRVIPARLLGYKASGGQVEVMLERILEANRVLAQVRASKSPKSGSRMTLEDAVDVEVVAREGDLFLLQFPVEQDLYLILEKYGRLPLPPYIEREPERADRDRYQTIYARHPGAVAAPTAGLHFDSEMLSALQKRGIETAHVTLHVGAGTFQPVRVENIAEHRIHKEWIDVSPEVCQAIACTRQRQGRVIAVGTTAVRCLETAAQVSGSPQPYRGDTQLFIYPGYQFQVVDGILTNFHLPKSSLLMLVCAFGGYEPVMNAYKHAVAQTYRFFSYGDAMLLI